MKHDKLFQEVFMELAYDVSWLIRVLRWWVECRMSTIDFNMLGCLPAQALFKDILLSRVYVPGCNGLRQAPFTNVDSMAPSK